MAELDQMALPPCHKTYQFFVADGRLTGLLYQRSADLALGVPFNIYSAAALIHMLAKICGLEAGELIWQGGDVHLYANHRDLVEQQLSRTPNGAPTLRFARQPKDIFSFTFEDFIVENYQPQGHLSAPVAV